VRIIDGWLIAVKWSSAGVPAGSEVVMSDNIESGLNSHEKSLILRGRILFAIEQYVRRTGESPETTKQVLHNWIKSREFIELIRNPKSEKRNRA
jgi:hypothetical protein